MNSDQPVIPSSVDTLRNEFTRQPASQCRVSILVIFIGTSRLGGIMRRPIDAANFLCGQVADASRLTSPGAELISARFPRARGIAQVAELVDAQVSGTCGRNVVEVRVFSWAPAGRAA